mmetsp:Transcript_5921/g.17816  ORF Transcript_5921/g.17816 Transcript_5921/m.17816 type:complete len:424 (-) Transcript_5921:236-1507(-)
MLRNKGFEVFVFDPFLLVRHSFEPLENLIQVIVADVITHLREPRLHGVAPAVLAKNNASVDGPAQAYCLWRHDLISLLRLEHAVLVDSALVRESVHADDGFVGLDHHPRVLAHHLARHVNVLRDDSRVETIHLLLSPQHDRHGNLLQRRVACSLPDAVDRALELPGAVLGAGQAVRRREAQVVLAVGREDDTLYALHVRSQFRDELPELERQVPTSGVRDVQRRGPRLDDLPQDPVQELGPGSASVFGAELNVVAAQALEVLHGVHRVLHDLVLRHPQLVLHVDVRRSDERVHPRKRSALHRVPGRVQVSLYRSGESTNHWDVAIILGLSPHRIRDQLHGLEVVRRGPREPCLDDIHPELGQLPRDLNLLVDGQSRARGLLAVPERRVEYPHVVRVIDLAGHVLWPLGPRRGRTIPQSARNHH